MRQKQNKRKTARGKAASSFGLFDRQPRLPPGLPTPAIMQDYLDKITQYQERAWLRAQLSQTNETREAALLALAERLHQRLPWKRVIEEVNEQGFELSLSTLHRLRHKAGLTKARGKARRAKAR